MYGIFDNDGTLINSVYDVEQGYPREFVDVLSSEFKISAEQKDRAIEYYLGPGGGIPVENQYPQVLELLGLPLQNAPNLALRYHERICSKVYPVYPDAMKCMKALIKIGFANNCVSSGMKQDHLERTLRHHNLDTYFDFWIGNVPSMHDKVGHIDEIVRGFKTFDEDVRLNSFYVGDSYRDMEISSKIWGVKHSIFVNRRNIPASEIVSGLEARGVDAGTVKIIKSLDDLPHTLSDLEGL